MLKTRSVILAKLETTYRTDPTLSASTDAVLAENLSFAPTGAKMVEQAVVKNTLGPRKQVYGGSLWQITFDVKIKGSGAAGTAPEFGPLLQACGCGETVVASTSVTYAPASSGIKSVYLELYEDGKLYEFGGVRGDVTLKAEAGGAGMLSFTLTGHLEGISDTALPSPTYDSTVPAPFINAGFAIGGYAGVISSLEMAFGNTVATPPSVNSDDGFGEIRITNRDVTGSFDPEDVLIATHDWIAQWQASTALALATGTIGGTAGNRWALSMPAVSYREATPGDRDNIRTFQIGYGAHESSGDDQFSLAFT